jgi:hypothetical protein
MFDGTMMKKKKRWRTREQHTSIHKKNKTYDTDEVKKEMKERSGKDQIII